MEETKDPNASAGGGDAAQGTPERDEEATSSETLSDIEESTKVKGGDGGSGSGSGGGSLEGSTPSPDAGGSGGGRADGSDTGGPM